MPDSATGPRQLDPRTVGSAIALVVAVGLLMVLTGWTGDATNAAVACLRTLGTALPLVILWLGTAAGLGVLVMSRLDRRREGSPPTELAATVGVGVALLLILDATLGALGLFAIPGLAWAMLVLGAAGFAGWLGARAWRSETALSPPDALAWASIPAVVTLLVAATSAPGWLWTTEFGGYDALAYHLQLPREWMDGGILRPLEHNVYSALPSYMEAAYLHVMTLVGDPICAAAVCQLLHAAITVLAAWCTGRVAARLVERAGVINGGRTASIIAATLVLATPWLVVVGSLAYNESATVLLLATGLLLALDHPPGRVVTPLLAGLVVGAAAGELTAMGFVVLPVAVFVCWVRPPRGWARDLALGGAGVLLALAPYLVRNAVALGNPVFPFIAADLGAAHWTAEQVVIWSVGHGADATPLQAIGAFWHQWLRFGIGPNPDPAEPWLAQWSILPLLGLVALALVLSTRKTRRDGLGIVVILGIQILFWLVFTHLKSRFLVPTVVPLAVLVAVATLTGLRASHQRAAVRVGLTVVLLILATGPLLVFRAERGGAPAGMIGAADHLAGRGLTDDQRRAAGVPAMAITWLLPPDARVLLVGDATPFYILRSVTYTTTWDRGPVSEILADPASSDDGLVAGLRARGFTHVLVNGAMLRRWEAARWNDPGLRADTLEAVLDAEATALARYPGGVTLYALTP